MIGTKSRTMPASPAPPVARAKVTHGSGCDMGSVWRGHLARVSEMASMPQARRSFGQSVGRRAWFASRRTAQASATGPRCPSLSGLITERIVWICPSRTSSARC